MTLVTEPIAETIVVAPAAEPVAVPSRRWSLTTRLAFRFFATYFTLYVLGTQMYSSLIVVPWGRVPSPLPASAVRDLATLFGTRVMGFRSPLFVGGGSGDKPYDYSVAVAFVAIAAAITLLWSVLDRRRLNYERSHKWFRLFLRFALGGTLLTYGMIKAIPVQMPFPTLTRLLEPYGHFSLMGVLWAQLGASPAYQTFTGVVELTCAILLFIPGMTVAGALLSLAATTQVLVLNLTYDVPVKLFSLHLVAMSLMLLAPDARRLFAAALLRRAVPDAPEPPLARRRTLNRVLLGAQIVFAAWLVFNSYNSVVGQWRTFGAGAPKPALYGIWLIERMTIDGVERAPLVTDYDRWRRLAIQNATVLAFQRMDDTFIRFAAKVDVDGRSIALTRTDGPKPAQAGTLKFDRPQPDRLILDGYIDGRRVRMETRLFDVSSLQLMKSQFRWIQERPFNR